MIDDKLLQLKTRLDEQSQWLNSEIINFEDRLKELGLGIAACVQLSDKTKLCYRRVNAKSGWKLTIHTTEDGESQWWILTQAPRTLRLYAYKNLDKLLDGIYETGLGLLKKLEEANKLAEELKELNKGESNVGKETRS